MRTAREIALARGGGYSAAEYKRIREALAAVNTGASFLYCEADNRLIWRVPGQPWREDIGYARFRELADAIHGPEIGARTLGYFKRYCVTLHIDVDSKKRHLAGPG